MAIIKVEKRIKGSDGLYTDVVYQKTSADLVVTTTGDVQTDLDSKAPLLHTHNVVSKTSSGFAPQLPNETTITKYLRQDGTWAVPPDTNISSVAWDGITGVPNVFPPEIHTHISVSSIQPTNSEEIWYKIIN